jgi:hypothetical protein
VIEPIKERRRKRKKHKNSEEEMEDRKAYPSDLTDAEWEILEPLIPAISEEAAHVKYTRREIESAHPLRLAQRLDVLTASQRLASLGHRL